ncbi:MAG TPA: CYTH domain-containing protein [Saprospiraceae bacterium]|nr:CYTH domain-containing protein [Saprospiraceae bacterium]
MAQEIEKKFLVTSDAYKAIALKKIRITQGYLSSVPERTVRVRIKGESGFLTIKGIGNDSGASRYEWEKEIPLAEAQELMKICEPGVIDKTRYEVPAGTRRWEVDEFHGDNEGLVVAELELANENDAFIKPGWIGNEVTGKVEYYNAMLMKTPYRRWPKTQRP